MIWKATYGPIFAYYSYYFYAIVYEDEAINFYLFHEHFPNYHLKFLKSYHDNPCCELQDAFSCDKCQQLKSNLRKGEIFKFWILRSHLSFPHARRQESTAPSWKCKILVNLEARAEATECSTRLVCGSMRECFEKGEEIRKAIFQFNDFEGVRRRCLWRIFFVKVCIHVFS